MLSLKHRVYYIFDRLKYLQLNDAYGGLRAERK